MCFTIVSAFLHHASLSPVFTSTPEVNQKFPGRAGARSDTISAFTFRVCYNRTHVYSLESHVRNDLDMQSQTSPNCLKPNPSKIQPWQTYSEPYMTTIQSASFRKSTSDKSPVSKRSLSLRPRSGANHSLKQSEITPVTFTYTKNPGPQV